MGHTIAIYGIAFMSILFVGGLNLFDNDSTRKQSGIARSRGVDNQAQRRNFELDSHL